MEGHIERTIRVNGQLMDLSTPKVMGILNVTPDSFYAGSRKETTSDIVNRVEQIITEGADMIDIGAYSSRPNAEHVSTKEEMARPRSHPRSRPRGHRFRRYIPGRRGLYVCGRIRRSSHQ